MDKILINRIALRPIVGTLPTERIRRQAVFADLEIEVDLTAASRSDDLCDTIDYSMIERGVAEFAERSSFRLLEALAGNMAELVLRIAPGAKSCRVRVEKPGGAAFGRSVSVEIFRERG